MTTGVAPRTRVAFDVGPLSGRRTGIGQAVEHLLTGLHGLPSPPVLVPYVLSFRAELSGGTARLRYPASLAHRCWARWDHPRPDRMLGRPDVVHGTNYVVPPSKAARLVTVYDCWFLRHPDQVHPDIARAGQVLRRAVATGATVHASSEATAAAVRELLGAPRVEVIPLGPIPTPRPDGDTARPAALADGRPFVLAIGTKERRKNLPVLVRAFGSAHSSLGGCRLVLAGGDGDDAAAVAAAIDALPTEARADVVTLGFVDDSTRAWLTHRAEVLAYPSLDEGFGFPLLTAMAAGVPVVASTAGSIPEVVGTAGLLVDPADVEGLAAALVRALDDTEWRAHAIDTGRHQAEQFDWRTTASALADLYDALAMEHRPA